MKAVILAGGLGTRISEETHLKPKPMIEIGGRPILWHILKTYSNFGISDFIICLGYRGYLVKEYFSNYFLHMSDVTFDLPENVMTVHQQSAEPWTVTLVDTGESTNTGGRLKRVASYLEGEEDFCFTYGDGLTNANLAAEIEFHRSHGAKATVLAVRPPGRFGALKLDENSVRSFEEKPEGDGGYINGGYFVLDSSCLETVTNDRTIWESDSLVELASANELRAFKHDGFWSPMDTLREKNELENLWASGAAPWKVW